jgi:hypothetical protein
MYQSEISFNKITYTIEFVEQKPRAILVGKTIKVHIGSSVTDKLRNYVSALLMVAQGNKTNLPKLVDLEVACRVVETLIAPASTEIGDRPRDYTGTGYRSIGDGVSVISRDGA